MAGNLKVGNIERFFNYSNAYGDANSGFFNACQFTIKEHFESVILLTSYCNMSPIIRGNTWRTILTFQIQHYFVTDTDIEITNK